MTEQTTTMSDRARGSAASQGALWGERANDWADVMEGWNGWGISLYRHVLSLAPLSEGSDVLDIGCGAGRFCRMAADRGARVTGLDATPALIDIARERVLGGDFRVGEMEELPWEDDSFDLVTGFNSFFIAADMVAALREAARVARPGAHVALTVFGRPEHCDSTRVFAVLGRLARAPEESGAEPANDPAPAKPTLADEGGLEAVAEEAGLAVEHSGYFGFEEEHRDTATAACGMLAAPPFRRAAASFGEAPVRAAVMDALEPFQRDDGRCRLSEEARYLVARA
jgi:SAM-dependent methyltransferase